MKLSQEAARWLHELAKQYAITPPENYRVWLFDRGADDPVHRELASAGLIEHLGTKGSGWRLTDRGVTEVRKLAESVRHSTSEARTMEDKQRARFQFLKTLYVLTDGDADQHILEDELASASGLGVDEFRKAETYLEGEGLVVGACLSSISITHRGVVEYERTLTAAQGHGAPSTYFATEVVRPVINQHFHGPVGAVQTGDGSVANVHQNLGIDPANFSEQLSRLADSLASDSSPDAETSKALIVAAKKELSLPVPDWQKLKAFAGPLLKTATAVGTPVLVAYLKQLLGL